MILVDLKDGQGLGNQLWLIASGIFIAKQKSRQLVIRNIDQFFAKDLLTDKFFTEVQMFDPSLLEKEWYVFNPFPFINTKFNEFLYFRENEKFLDLFDMYEYIEIEGNYQSTTLINTPKILKDYFDFSNNLRLENLPADLCLINVRGGDTLGLFKTPCVHLKYFYRCISTLKKDYPNIRFKIISDDYEFSKLILPDFEIIKGGIAEDFMNLQNANFLIISHSSFAFFPAYLSNTKNLVLAPYGWGSSKRITENHFWQGPCNFYEKFNFVNNNGEIIKNITYYQTVFNSNKDLIPPSKPMLSKRKFLKIKDVKNTWIGNKIGIKKDDKATLKDKIRRFLTLKIWLLRRNFYQITNKYSQ
ncbi:hypothetical protein HA149_07095 [Prochlorococcus marinus XMU1406]|uniref:alpha-1,2-fucosyltransferase n=1 Tax=Prochlorococcus marinus TaxID=1219 RepID=UPI001ADAE956|nr:alpha-1,2-fucosyltransferase [Prochlorococcus marinus]MBO8206823.1 hypothetical protein [Prochlorococcus marinus XMU1406]MCR8542642.1 alpha-1,2-fucosyltransferase [Prochlorococcus marinus XMU1427]